MLAAADDVVKPMLPRLPWMDRAAITQGYAGVYSIFLLHAERASERYGVPAHEILQRVGELGYVGGQEDMIIDVALTIVHERETGSPPRRSSTTRPASRRSPQGARCDRCRRWTVDRAATELLRCEDERTDREPITDEWPALDLPTAYEIQDETLRRRLDRGETLVGVKLGLTSRAKQQRMNVDVARSSHG